nr:GDP-L-fucose synthase [uncultured Mucilaginibacter sp.]
MDLSEKILVAGGTGLAGSAIVRGLIKKGFTNVIATHHTRNPADCFKAAYLASGACKFIKIDLLDPNAVIKLFKDEEPQYVFLAAARVGGIMANHTYRAQFIYENLQIQNNIIHNSYLAGVKKLIFLGSTCIYPTNAPQPMHEGYLLTDTLEYLSEPYGIAKIAGIKMCESYNVQYGTNYISVMPTNLYGPNDNYDLTNSHFLPAFIRKMHLGKSLMNDNWDAIRSDLARNPVEGIGGDATESQIIAILQKYGIRKDDTAGGGSILLWGTGKPRREVMHASELADACLYIMEKVDFTDLLKYSDMQYSAGIVKNEVRNTQINIGLGTDYALYDIAYMVKDVVGYKGDILWNHDMPDGTLQKLTGVNRLKELGWQSSLNLKQGIKETYEYYITN